MNPVVNSRVRSEIAHQTPPDVLLAQHHQQHHQPLVLAIDASPSLYLLQQRPSGLQGDVLRGRDGPPGVEALGGMGAGRAGLGDEGEAVARRSAMSYISDTERRVVDSLAGLLALVHVGVEVDVGDIAVQYGPSRLDHPVCELR